MVADKLLKKKHRVLMSDGRGLTNTSFNMEVFTPRSGRKWLVTEIFFAPASNYCWKLLSVGALYKSCVETWEVKMYCIFLGEKERGHPFAYYQIYIIYYTPSIMRWAGHVARMGEERGVYRILVGKR